MIEKSKKDQSQDKEKINKIKRLGHQVGFSELLDEGILQYEEEDEDYELYDPFTNLS